MMIDFALEAEREQGKLRCEAIYQACLLRFRPIMMTTMAALLRRRAAGARARHRLRAAPSARHRDRRRIDRQPDPDALHHARHLSLLRRSAKTIRAARARRRAGDGASRPQPEISHEHFLAIHSSPVATALLTVGDRAGGRASRSGCCRSRRCRRWISRPSLSQALCRARARRPWPPRWPRRSNAVRPHRRRHRDDLVELPRHDRRHPAVRSEPEHRRRRPRRAGGHQRRPRLPPRQSPEQSDLPQSQSGRRADHDSGAHLGQADDRASCTTRRPPILQQNSQIQGVGQVKSAAARCPPCAST